MYVYVFGVKLPGGLGWLQARDPRWPNVLAKGWQGTVVRIADLAGKWATDSDYAAGLTRHFRDVIEQAAKTVVTEGDTPVATAYKSYSVPGGRRPLFLPAWINVQIKPVNLPRVRSGIKVGPKTMTTVHDTGNPRTNAAGEYAWLAAGRPGGVVGGYEWINDDKGIIITGWFDEETWAQGVKSGNVKSHAGELAFGGSVVWNTALEIACAMHGAVLEMENAIAEANAVLHQWWTNKWCAGQILNRGIAYWNNVVKPKILAYARAAATARAGGAVVDVPVTLYATPVMPLVDGKPWDGKADATINGVKFEAQPVTAKATGNLNMRLWASTDSPFTGPGYKAGESIDLLGWVAGELVDGVSEWWIDTKGNRLWAGAIDAEPKVDPDYGQEPEPPAGTEGGIVSVNGRPYYPLNDETTGELGRKITAQRDGDLYKWADTTSEKVGTISTGEERTFKYWTRGEVLPLTLKDGTVTEEMIWYAEDVYTGARMWSGLSDERPD
jgi:hypothetical protein